MTAEAPTWPLSPHQNIFPSILSLPNLFTTPWMPFSRGWIIFQRTMRAKLEIWTLLQRAANTIKIKCLLVCKFWWDDKMWGNRTHRTSGERNWYPMDKKGNWGWNLQPVSYLCLPSIPVVLILLQRAILARQLSILLIKNSLSPSLVANFWEHIEILWYYSFYVVI